MFEIFVLVISNLVERRWKTMSPGIILRLVMVNSSIVTSDSKEAKNEGWSLMLDLFKILILPLIMAMIDILETATDLI